MERPLPKLFVIGDSISIQYGPYLEQYLRGTWHYARKTGDAGNLDVPQGANGGDSSMVLAYLRAMRESGGIDADVLLLNCGLHDIKTDRTTLKKQVLPELYKQNLRDILALVKGMQLNLAWVRTTPVDEKLHAARKEFLRFEADVDAYNAAADQVMSERSILCIDLYTLTTNLGNGLHTDGVHFHEPIRQLQAAYIAGWLEGQLNVNRKH